MIVYLKDSGNIINRGLKGTIVLSDSHEYNKLCTMYGIVHIFMNIENLSNNIKLDCIYASERDQELEERLILNNIKVPIVYKTIDKKWCGVCNTLCEPFASKYCSEKCMQSFFDSDLIDLNKNYILENIFSSSKKNYKIDKKDTSLKKDSSLKKDKSSNSNEKFQTSMIKEAVRLEYALKRESYKKEIRQPSLRKTVISNKKTSNPQTTEKICKSDTRKGIKCTNKAVENSNFCGIISHNKIEE